MMEPNEILAQLMGGDGGLSRKSALELISKDLRVQSTALPRDSREWTSAHFDYVHRWTFAGRNWTPGMLPPFDFDRYLSAANKAARRHGFRTPWDGSLESAHLPIAETIHSLSWKHLRVS